MARSDNGTEMTAADTRQFMALMAITQHHGRPGTPTVKTHIESFFALKERLATPHRTHRPGCPGCRAVRIRGDYNTRRLHAAIGYVTLDDEYHGRGPGIRRAQVAGLKHARVERIKRNR